MAFWKQAVIAAMLVVGVFFAFGRFYPGAGEALARLGLDPALIAIATGGSGETGGEQAAQGQRGPAGAPAGQRPGGPRGGASETLVEIVPVRTAKINDRVNAIGDGAALRSVSVVPLSAGVIMEVAVSAGDKVEVGQVLARLDSEAEEVARDRAELALQTAREKLARTERLASSRAATEVAVSDARVEVATAELALRDAALDLSRRAITAPIAGIAGIVQVEPGSYVTTQTQIATIDDRSKVIVDFWVPERFAGLVRKGQEVQASPIALPDRRFSGEVDAVGSRIERESRTLQIRALIDNPEDVLRPGMSFRVEMAFPGEEFPAVDPLAIQWSSDGAFVWKVQDGKAQRTSVRIVQRNSDSVLVQAALSPGEQVVTEGVQSLREGSALRIAGQEAAQGPRS